MLIVLMGIASFTKQALGVDYTYSRTWNKITPVFKGTGYERSSSGWQVAFPPIDPSFIVLCFAVERSKSALVPVSCDNFQIPVARVSGQYNGSFQSHDFRALTIALRNIYFPQNIDHGSFCMNPLSMLQHVCKVSERDVPLGHAKHGMLGKIKH